MTEAAVPGLASDLGAQTVSNAPKESEHALLLYCPEQGRWLARWEMACLPMGRRDRRGARAETDALDACAGVARTETLDPNEALKLFKMYEDKGWAVKQQMVSIVAWVTPIVFALLALAAKEYCAPWTSETEKLLENLGPLASATASAIALFTGAIIFGNLRHSEQDYRNADDVIKRAKELNLFPAQIQAIFDKQAGTPLIFRLFGLFHKIGAVYVIILLVYITLSLMGLILFLRPQVLNFFCKRRVDLGSIFEPLIGAFLACADFYGRRGKDRISR